MPEQNQSEDRKIKANHDHTSGDSERQTTAAKARAQFRATPYHITYDDGLKAPDGGSNEVAAQEDVKHRLKDERASVASNRSLSLSVRGDIPRTKFTSSGHKSGYSSAFLKKGSAETSHSFTLKYIVAATYTISSDEYRSLCLAFDPTSEHFHL